eukprot:m.91083 g.91083  ORF g.91083 m.91083 type:complete len:230 (-) comp13288_c0_seq5:1804-2493(-)
MEKMNTEEDGQPATQQAPEETPLNFNKLIMNFLVVEGHKDASVAFEKETGEKPMVDLSVVEQRMKIRSVVQDGNIIEAMTRVNDINPEILDTHQQLYFRLHLQRLIDLISEDKIEQALDFAEKELAVLAKEDTECMQNLEEVMGLFAFQDKHNSPLSHLLQATQRQKTASELNRAILSSQGQDTRPRLYSLLKLLLWAQERLEQRNVPHIKYNLDGDIVSDVKSDVVKK